MHLVSRVVGELRHDLDALHAYRACMNIGDVKRCAESACYAVNCRGGRSSPAAATAAR
ncbi:hypothetical protein ACLB1R_11490 [Escherichia coli]